MKKVILITLLIGTIFFTSCESKETKVEKLLNEAQEEKLTEYYDKYSVKFLDPNSYILENNEYKLKDDVLMDCLQTLFDFHIEHHVSLLSDEDTQKEWFYFYEKLNSDSLSYSEKEKYESLVTKCKFCTYIYDNKLDISYDNFYNTFINEYPDFVDSINYEIDKLTQEKKEKDAAIAQAAAEKAKAEADKASRFNGVWGCNFGMSSSAVYEILSERTGIDLESIKNMGDIWNSITFDNEGILLNANAVTGRQLFSDYFSKKQTYSGLPVNSITVSFIDDKLACISLNVDDATKYEFSTALENIKNKFRFTYDSEEEKGGITYKYYKKDNILLCAETWNYFDMRYFTFLDTTIKNDAVKKYKAKKNEQLSTTDDF